MNRADGNSALPPSIRRGRPVRGERKIVALPDTRETVRQESVVEAYQRMIYDRLDQGLLAIESAASSLLREVATEVWTGATAQADDDPATSIRERLLPELARDQAIRGMMASHDERFQTVSMKVDRLETGMQLLTDAMKRLMRRLTGEVDSLRHGEGGRVAERIEELAGEVTNRLATVEGRLEGRMEQVAAEVRHELSEVAGAVGEQAAAGTATAVALTGLSMSLDNAEQRADETARTLIDAVGTLKQHLVPAVEQTRSTSGTLVAMQAAVNESIQRMEARTANLDDGLAEVSQEMRTLGHEVERAAADTLNHVTVKQSEMRRRVAADTTKLAGGIERLAETETVIGERLVKEVRAASEALRESTEETLAQALLRLEAKVVDRLNATIESRVAEAEATVAERAERAVKDVRRAAPPPDVMGDPVDRAFYTEPRKRPSSPRRGLHPA